jgi:hypothetical protein
MDDKNGAWHPHVVATTTNLSTYARDVDLETTAEDATEHLLDEKHPDLQILCRATSIGISRGHKYTASVFPPVNPSVGAE